LAENWEQLASRAESRAGDTTARNWPTKGGSGDSRRSGLGRKGVVRGGSGDSCFIVREGVRRVGGWRDFARREARLVVRSKVVMRRVFVSGVVRRRA
jgi:hypothetical protein